MTNLEYSMLNILAIIQISTRRNTDILPYDHVFRILYRMMAVNDVLIHRALADFLTYKYTYIDIEIYCHV